MNDSPMHENPETFQKLQTLYAEGETAIAARDFDTAVQKFTEGIAIDDNFRQRYVTMYAQRAFCYQMQQRFDEAIADLTKAIEMEPEMNRAEYLFKRGMCHYHGTKDMAKAQSDFSASIALYPNHPGPYDFRGRINYDADRFEEALPDIERAIELSQNPSDYLLQIREYIRGQLGLGTVDPAGDDDPEIFPGEPVSRLGDYVGLMKKMQAGDMPGALAAYGLDMTQYAAVAQRWAMKMSSDPDLAARYAQLIAS